MMAYETGVHDVDVTHHRDTHTYTTLPSRHVRVREGQVHLVVVLIQVLEFVEVLKVLAVVQVTGMTGWRRRKLPSWRHSDPYPCPANPSRRPQ